MNYQKAWSHSNSMMSCARWIRIKNELSILECFHIGLLIVSDPNLGLIADKIAQVSPNCISSPPFEVHISHSCLQEKWHPSQAKYFPAEMGLLCIWCPLPTWQPLASFFSYHYPTWPAHHIYDNWYLRFYLLVRDWCFADKIDIKMYLLGSGWHFFIIQAILDQ